MFGRATGRWAVATAMAGTVLIGLGAFWLSFTALADLAVASGIAPGQAWAWPLIVDGIIVVATVAVVALGSRRQAWYPWLLLIGASIVSVTANAIHATLTTTSSVPAGIAALVAAIPPVVLLAVTHLTVVLTHTLPTAPDAGQGRPAEPTTRDETSPAPTTETALPPEPVVSADEAHPAPGAAMDDGGQEPRDERPLDAGGKPTLGGDITHVGYGGEVPERSMDNTRTDSGLHRRRQAADWKRQGLSNREIAARLGVHPSTVGRWLAGDT